MWYHQESNRGHKDFQSFALPTELWHHIIFVRRMRLELTQPNGHYPLKVACLPISPPGRDGAKNGTRTRDPDLGKVVLYQLSYFRICSAKLMQLCELCKYSCGFLITKIQTKRFVNANHLSDISLYID